MTSLFHADRYESLLLLLLIRCYYVFGQNGLLQEATFDNVIFSSLYLLQFSSRKISILFFFWCFNFGADQFFRPIFGQVLFFWLRSLVFFFLVILLKQQSLSA